MTRPRFLLLLALAIVTATLAGRAQAPAASATPKIEFEKFTLPNGLQVILHVDRKLPIVHVNEWFHVGSKNEKPGRTGFAHLFEHMMFEGSKDADGGYWGYAEKAGRQRPRGRRQRHDQQRSHELLHHRAVGEPRARAVARVGSNRHADRRHRPEEARQPARRREERAAPEPGEPAVRTRVHPALRLSVPCRPPVPLARHRQPGRPHRGEAR